MTKGQASLPPTRRLHLHDVTDLAYSSVTLLRATDGEDWGQRDRIKKVLEAKMGRAEARLLEKAMNRDS